MNNYKRPSDKQIAHFITESNAIEEIYFDEDIVFDALKKKTNVPEIDNHIGSFNEMLNWMLSDNYTHIKLEHISRLHQTLMKDLLEPHHFGFRKEWVRVGIRLCPPPIAVSALLNQWCKKVNAMEHPTEDAIWEAHLAYEYIHPFIDGNGRSGRLIWLWLRYKHGYGYKCIENKTKFTNYYPEFDHFQWEQWFDND